MTDRNFDDWKPGDMIRWEDNYEGPGLHPIKWIGKDRSGRGHTWVRYENPLIGGTRTTMSTNLERIASNAS